MNSNLAKHLLILTMGMLVGAVAGTLIDRIFGWNTFSKHLMSQAFKLELYIIKVEIQFTPASLTGLVVTGYLLLRKKG